MRITAWWTSQHLQPSLPVLLLTLILANSVLAIIDWKAAQLNPEFFANRGSWGAPPPAKGAYVFTSANEDTDGHYFDLLLASIQCLQETNPVYHVAIIWEAPYTAKERSAFAALNVSKVYHYPAAFRERQVKLNTLENRTAGAYEQHWMWKKNWNKLLVWTLTEYDKVVSLDPDVIAHANADALLDFPELSAGLDWYSQVYNEEHANQFNSGTFVAEPDMEVFEAMMQILDSGYDAWYVDQGFLNDVYERTWHSIPVPYALWPRMMHQGVGFGGEQKARFVHHVGESSCGDCNLGHKSREDCESHGCPSCCLRVVHCREEAHRRIHEYRQKHGENPDTLNV